MVSYDGRMIRRPLALFAVASFGLALAACGDAQKSGASASASGGSKQSKSASCNVIQTESICREYGDKNIEAAGEDFLQKMCSGLKGEFKMESCPKDKRVGTCATDEGTKVFYKDGAFPLDAAKAEKSCKEGVPAGQWKAAN